MKRSVLAFFVLTPFLFRCAGEAGGPEVVAPPLVSAPIQLVDATVCSIDADCNPGLSCFLGGCAAQCSDGSECASGECDVRGVCSISTDKTGSPSLPAGPPSFRLDGVAVVRAPDTVIEVAQGQQSVTVEIETTGAVLPQGGFSYRVDSSIDASLAARIFTSPDATTHRITLDTGLRDAGEKLVKSVSIRIITPLGDIPLVLKAAPTIGGHYEGTLQIGGLGATVPVSFGIQTVRPTVDLVASEFTGTGANKAYLVAFAGAKDVFAPVTPSDLPTAVEGEPQIEVVVAPLLYEADLDAWVATFENGFNIPEDESFGQLPDGQVKRELRYELHRELDGSFTGSLSDRFTGLYDAAASDGSISPSEAIVGGTFSVERSGDEPAAATDGVPVPSLPVIQGFALSADCEALAAETADCATIGTFEGAYLCAEALSAGTLGQDNLIDVIAGLLSGEGALTESGATFEDFLAGCADGTEPLCVPSVEALCGIEMHAVAIGLAPGGWSEEKENLWAGFSSLLLQTTGGPQLGAFYTDVGMRREWLENATYGATAVTAAASAQLNARLMDDYFDQVVEVNARALRSYMAPSTFAFLSRGPDSPSAKDQRDQLLIAMVGSWTATADSLALAAQRWNELYRLDGQRAIKADLVAGRIRELYINAAVIIQLHQEAGKAAEAAPVAASLGGLLQRLATLERTFNDLLFDRYAQVTQSASLDPTVPANSVLKQRREAALEAVADASLRVDTILANLLKDDIRNQDFSNALDDRVATSEGFLVELCGQPVGCDILTAEGAPAPDGICEVSWKPGVCGFDQPKGPLEDRTPRAVLGFESAASPSIAGLAVKAIKDAAIDMETSQNSLTQFAATTLAMQQTADAFKASTTRWHDESLTNANLINAILKNETARQGSQLKLHLAHLKANQASWEDSLQKREAAADDWSQIRSEHAGNIIYLGIVETTARLIADLFDRGKDLVDDLAEAGAEGAPKTLGLANDVFFALRLVMKLTGALGAESLSAGAHVSLIAAEIAAVEKEILTINFEKDLANSEAAAETAEFARETQRAIAELQDDRDQATDGVVAAELEQLISNLDRQLELRQGYERDLVELDDRRNELLSRTVEMAERVGALAHAAIAYDTAVLEYYRNCELAAQEKSALDMVRGFRSSIHQLIAGPQALFATANGLTEAERELDRARTKMADWLVAIEFAAVRPFFNERMSILLARNTYQLRAIADRLRDLESRCGGATNLETTTVSVRDDLLGLRDSQTDPDSGVVLTPGARFWFLAQNTSLPANTEMRYSASETVEQGTAGNGDLFVVNVTLRPTDFANLSQTCNAKLDSIAVRLVGEGLGSGQPVVTILYGGASSMYSCQPGIDSYVRTFAQGNTAYGANSNFVTEGRAITPVAGISQMGSANQTLSGMPLASDYTIIIDPSLPANRGVDWTKLNDVELQVSYTYQDVFGATSECANAL